MKRFNEKMGKVQKYSKGGLIKKIASRKYFDAGGSTTLSGPSTTQGGGVSPATVNNNGLTGTIGNELGLNNQFQGQSANIQNGTNVGQLNNAYNNAQYGLTQQQMLANQTQPGVAQGVNTQANLTGQLQGVINGTGPNAAQTALNQNTATNVANQAALMAGQRGASANPGLLARQAAMQGAATQQQAVGQAATTQAQQQIAAQQQLAGLAQTQVGQGAQAVQGVNSAQQNEQNILQGANTAANNANVSMQSNINNVNAGVAGQNQQQAGNVVNGIGSALSSVGGFLGLAKGGEVSAHHCAGAHCTDRAHYAHMMAAGGPLEVAPVAVAQPVSNPWVSSQPNTAAPASEGAAAPIQNIGNPFAFANKSSSSSSKPTAAQTSLGNSQLEAAPEGDVDLNMYSGMNSVAKNKGGAIHKDNGGIIQEAESLAPLAALALSKGGPIDWHAHFSDGGPVEAMVSAKERYLNPEEVEEVVKHGANPLKLGTVFKGKAKVKGDSLKNDVIPATLREGGVILPRHITNKKSRDHAELFVRRAVHMKAPKGGAK